MLDNVTAWVGTEAKETGTVPLTLTVGVLLILKPVFVMAIEGRELTTTVPETGTGVAINCVSVNGPVTGIAD